MPPDNVRSGLPAQATRFIGRERQIDEIAGLLETANLVTLTGPGGAGKTRLALEVGRRGGSVYPHGVHFVELAALTNASLVPHTIATALGVREAAGRTIRESLLGALRDRAMLVILDNCEHLVSACAHLVHEWLGACPSVRVLATSREPLSIPGEAAYIVPPLSLPPDGTQADPDALRRSEAGRLFEDRAARASHGFAVTPANARAVAQICRRLDGAPLAIELAAARIRALSADQIASRLDDRFNLLAAPSRAGHPRHHTLRAAIDWSYELLDPADRTLLARVSVFAGGFMLDAAEAVCADDTLPKTAILDGLARLIDKSLVAADTHGGAARYRLQDSVRHYARERLLESGEQSSLLARHRDWCLTLAELAEPQLQGPAQSEWLARLTVEHDNLREALAFALEGGSGDAAVRLAAALWWFWHVRGYLSEGRAWLSRALAAENPASGGTPARARALYGQGFLAWRQGLYDDAAALGKASLALAHARGDALGIASASSLLEHVARSRGDYAQAVSLPEQSVALFRGMGDMWGVATSLVALGNAARLAADYSRARGALEESLGLFRQLGDASGLAAALHFLGLVARDQRDWARAETAAVESLQVSREQGDASREAFSLHLLGLVARDQCDYARAQQFFEQSLELFRGMGDAWGVTTVLVSLGTVALRSGDADRASALLGESLTIRRDLGDRAGIAECLQGLADVAAVRGDVRNAARWTAAADALRDALGTPPPGERPDRGADRTIEMVRRRLGKRAFEAERASGRDMTMQQAVEEALAAVAATGAIPSITTGTAKAASAASEPLPSTPSRYVSPPANGEAGAAVDRSLGGPGGVLTGREREVVALIAEGRSNKEIAAALVVTLGTAANHVQHILNKLGLHSRSQIAAWAVQHRVRRGRDAAGGRRKDM
jgi:non-specific serine/threonine protein kinase